jgi:hypothetical protein
MRHYGESSENYGKHPIEVAFPESAHSPLGAFKMPEKHTLERAHRDKRQGKAPSTQAGEFIEEEIEHIRHGVHGARSTKQAIAIGLSKARRAGIAIPPAGKKSRSGSPRPSRKKQMPNRGSSQKRARAALQALRREGSRSASPRALSRFARASARKRGSLNRRRAATKASRTRARNRSKGRR